MTMRTYSKTFRTFLKEESEEKSPAYLIGLSLGFITLVAFILFVKAWALQLILSWFAVKLLLWQCALIIVFIESLLP
jgi:hypothetical protein